MPKRLPSENDDLITKKPQPLFDDDEVSIDLSEEFKQH